MKKRFNLLPTYHFEENTDGKIKNAATRVLRDCRIFGNCGKNLFNWDAIDKTQDWSYVVNGTTVSILDNGAIVTGNHGNKTTASAYSNGWFAPGNSHGGNVTLAAGDTVTVSANIKAVTLSESFFDNNWCYMYLYGTTSITSDLQHQFPKDGTVQRVSQEFNITKSGSYHPVFTLNSNTLEITDIQIAVNNSDTTYEPYKTVGDLDAESGKYVLPVTISGENTAPKTTNLLLDAPLGVGESISCREKGLPVPELATLDPSITNCITFGSEVKPSSVTCEYYKY